MISRPLDPNRSNAICTVPVSRYGRVGRLARRYTAEEQRAIIKRISSGEQLRPKLLDPVESRLKKLLAEIWKLPDADLVITPHPNHVDPKPFSLARGAEVVSYPRLLIRDAADDYRAYYGLSFTVCAPPEGDEPKHPKIWSRLTMEKSLGEVVLDRDAPAWADFRKQSTRLHQDIVNEIAYDFYRAATDQELGPASFSEEMYEIFIHVSHLTDPEIRKLLREVNLESIKSVSDLKENSRFADRVCNFLLQAGYEPLPPQPFAFRPHDISVSDIRSAGWVRVQDTTTDGLSYQIETTTNQITVIGFGYASPSIRERSLPATEKYLKRLWETEAQYSANRVSQRLASHFAEKYAQ